MGMPKYLLVRVPFGIVAALVGWLAAYGALTLDRNFQACTTNPENAWLDENYCIHAFNNQVEGVWVAAGIAGLAILVIVFAARIEGFVRRRLLNRTAALLIATAGFLFGAIANAGTPLRSMLVLTFGVLAAIAFAGVVFDRRGPPSS